MLIPKYFYNWSSNKKLLLLLQRKGTALIAASGDGHTETVKCLIDANAQIDLQHRAST